MRNVLIISYYWPPSGGAGVQRWLKFSKYLPENGWKPYVITVDPEFASYPQRDESLLDDVADECNVIRTKSFEINNIYKKVSTTKEVPYGGFANESNPSFFQKLARFIRGNVFIPDARVGWNKYAYEAATRLLHDVNIDLVVTTGPPQSTHLVGLKLKTKLDVKWVADFRDPWTDIYYYDKLYHTPLAKKYDAKLQLKVLEKSDRITTVSNGFARLFESHHPQLKQKCTIIPNGFDSHDLESEVSNARGEGLSITYIGTISTQYNISGLKAAINKLDKKAASKVTLRFVGNTLDDLKDIVQPKDVNCKVEAVGYVSHGKALDYMRNSDVLLLVVPEIKNNEGIVPGKIFEYIGSKRQVLAIVPNNSDIEKVILETKAGAVFEYGDENGMADWLQAIIEGNLNYSGSSQALNRYSRSTLSKHMAEVFNGLIE